MARIDFVVAHRFDASPQRVWDEMTDWRGHAEWIPATRIEIHSDDDKTVGSTFTGYSGYGPLTLVDRMQITEITWDAAAQRGSCEVEKLGPVLTGFAGFVIAPFEGGARLEWFEKVTLPYVPQALAPIVNKLGAAGFAFGFKRLAKKIAA